MVEKEDVKMRKVVFLKNAGEFKKGGFRVILGEDEDCYHIQVDLHGEETMAFSKNDNGVIFQVV